MANPPWFDALLEACYHAHDPALHYNTAEGILAYHLRKWEVFPTPLDFRFPLPASFSCTYEIYSVEEIFVLLQRAVREGDEGDRAFALRYNRNCWVILFTKSSTIHWKWKGFCSPVDNRVRPQKLNQMKTVGI